MVQACCNSMSYLSAATEPVVCPVNSRCSSCCGFQPALRNVRDKMNLAQREPPPWVPGGRASAALVAESCERVGHRLFSGNANKLKKTRSSVFWFERDADFHGRCCGGGGVLPLLHGGCGRLAQDRIAAEDFHALDGAVRGDDYFQAHRAADRAALQIGRISPARRGLPAGVSAPVESAMARVLTPSMLAPAPTYPMAPLVLAT